MRAVIRQRALRVSHIRRDSAQFTHIQAGAECQRVVIVSYLRSAIQREAMRKPQIRDPERN